MALEPEDVKVLQRMIDDGARRSCAGAIRVVAHLERDQAAQLALLELAEGVQAGNLPIPGGELRAVLVPEEAADGYLDTLAEQEREPEGQPGEEQEEKKPLRRLVTGDVGEVYMDDGHGQPGSGWHLYMAEWVDLFDDRLRNSPHFVTAVNEAVEEGRPADQDTARMVADRVRELMVREGTA